MVSFATLKNSNFSFQIRELQSALRYSSPITAATVPAYLPCFRWTLAGPFDIRSWLIITPPITRLSARWTRVCICTISRSMIFSF